MHRDLGDALEVCNQLGAFGTRHQNTVARNGGDKGGMSAHCDQLRCSSCAVMAMPSTGT